MPTEDVRGLEETEILRGRWNEFREPLRLTDPASEGFGTGGLAQFVTDPGVRLLVVPPDPAASLVHLDSGFWTWWSEERQNPFLGAQRTIWGTQTTPTSDAAVTFNRRGDAKWDWESFLALHRNAALEVVLGGYGVRSWTAETDVSERAFWLTEIVGRTWVALELYAEVIERFEVEGPWELTLAMLNTLNAQLGNVATGWRDIDGRWPSERPRCPEPNVFLRREIEIWPDAPGRQDLAFALGSQIEDSWGMTSRRFLIHPDHEGAGSFDPTRYRGAG